MSRQPSEATQLRNAKSTLKEQAVTINRLERERDVYRARATKAEQEAAEWKERFDILLRREEPKQ